MQNRQLRRERVLICDGRDWNDGQDLGFADVARRGDPLWSPHQWSRMQDSYPFTRQHMAWMAMWGSGVMVNVLHGRPQGIAPTLVNPITAHHSSHGRNGLDALRPPCPGGHFPRERGKSGSSPIIPIMPIPVQN